MAKPPDFTRAISTPAKVPVVGFEVEEEEPVEAVEPQETEAVGPFPTKEDAAELMFLQAFKEVQPELPTKRTTPRTGFREVELGRRADIARQNLLTQRPELGPHIDQAWRSARTRIGQDYLTAEDLEKNYFTDAEGDREKHKDLVRRIKATPVKYIVNAKSNTGKEYQIPRTGTAIDNEVASMYLPGSIEHQLLTANIDPDDRAWRRYLVGAEDTPENRARIKDIGKTKDPEIALNNLQSLHNQVREGTKRIHVYVPIYEDPREGEATGATSAFNLDSMRSALISTYFQTESGGRGQDIFRKQLIKEFQEAGPPGEDEVGPQLDAEQAADIEIDRIRALATKKADDDLARIKAQFAGTFTYNRDSDSIKDYKKGLTYGGIGASRVPGVKELGAMTLPLRATEGYIETPDGKFMTQSEGGGIEFITDLATGGATPSEELIETGLTRSIDDLQRIAPSTFIAAPIWMAYKDWVLLHNGEDPAEGRREYILKRQNEIQRSDRVIGALATQYDPAGRIMMDGGRILFGDIVGETGMAKTAANLGFGAIMFGGMLSEVDALQGALAGTGATAGVLGGIPGLFVGTKGGYWLGTAAKGARMVTRLLSAAERFSKSASRVERTVAKAGGRNMDGDALVALMHKLQEEDTTQVTSEVLSRITERVAAKRNAPFTADLNRVVRGEQTHMEDAATTARATLEKARDNLPQLRSKRASDRVRREAALRSLETVTGLNVKQTALASEAVIATGALKMQTDKVATLKQAEALLSDDFNKAADSLLTRPVMPDEAAKFGKKRSEALLGLQQEINKIQNGKGSKGAFKKKLDEYQDNFGAYDTNLRVRIEIEKGHLEDAHNIQKKALEALDKSLREGGQTLAYEEADKIITALRNSSAENADEFIEQYTKMVNDELTKLDESIAKGSKNLVDGERRAQLGEAIIDAVDQNTLVPKAWSGQKDVVETFVETVEEFAAASRAAASVEGRQLTEQLGKKGKTVAELVKDEPELVDRLMDVVRGEQGPLSVLAANTEHGRNLVLGLVMDAKAGGTVLSDIGTANKHRLAMRKRLGISFWGDEATTGSMTTAWNFMTSPAMMWLRFVTTLSGLIRNSNIFTTDVSFLGTRFVPELQEAANAQKRETDNWFRDLGLIARFYGKKSPEAARSATRTYITSQQKITLPDEGRLVSSGYSIGGNQGFADPADSLFDFAMQNFTGIGATFQPVKGKTAKEVGNLVELQADKSQALQALVKAFVSDSTNAGDLWRVNQAVTSVGVKLNTVDPATGMKMGDAIRNMATPDEKFNALSDLVITELIAKAPRLKGGALDPDKPFVDVFRTLDDGTRVAGPKAEMKLYQVILGGAHEWQWALTVFDKVSGRLNVRQAGALLAYSSKDKFPRHLRSTVEVGDRVVPKAAAEDFIMVTKGSLTGTPDPKLMKPRHFGRKGPLAEATLPQIGYPSSMEILAIFKSDEGVNMARLKTDAGKVVEMPMEGITRTSEEFSSLDLIDGYMAFGIDLMKDRGITRKKWYHLRDQFVQFQIHSYDEFGRPRMIPKIELQEWSGNFKGLTKDLSVTLGEKANFMAGFDAGAHLLSKATNWWRTAVLFGPLGLKSPAQFVTQVMGDMEFVAREQGYRKAFQISLMSIPAWVPGVGPFISRGIQKAAAEASRPFGNKAPSILNSFVNNVVSDISTGVNEMRVYTTSKGNKVNINPAQLRREMTQAGVYDGGLTGEDSHRILHEAARRMWEKGGVKDHFEFGRNERNAYQRWFDVIRDTMDVATSRTKQLVWMDLRYNKGLSVTEAKRQMARTVFNYDNSLSLLEAATVAKLSAFYVYKKNAAASNLQAFVAPSKGLSGFARQLFWPTRYKRIKAYTQIAQQWGLDVRRDPAEEIPDIEEGVGEISPKLQIERRSEIMDLPDYALDRFVGTNGPIPIQGQLLAREAGQDWTTFSIGAGSSMESIVGLSFLSDTYFLLGATGASSLLPDVGLNTRKLKRGLVDRFLDQLFPGGQTIAEPSIKRFLDVPRFQISEDGVKVKAREAAMLETFGMYHTFGVKPGKDNVLRSNDWMFTNGIVDPMHHLGNTYHRTRLLATIAFGDVDEPAGLGDNVDPVAPVEIQIQQYLEPYRKLGNMGPRVDSFLRFMNLVDVDFYNSTKSRGWTTKDVEISGREAIKAAEGASEASTKKAEE